MKNKFPQINSGAIYNALLQAPVAMCILRGKEYIIEFVNDFYLQNIGRKADIVGKPLFESFPELKNQGLKELIDGVIESGEPQYVNEHEIKITRNGLNEIRFFNCSYQPFREQNDQITGTVVVFTDVSEQVKLRNESLESHKKLTLDLENAKFELAFQKVENRKRAEQFGIANIELAFKDDENEKRAAESIIANYARSLIEASLDPLVTISSTGKILDVNEASVKVTGVPREKLINTDFSNYFTEPIKAQEGYRQVFDKGFVEDYPLTIKHKNGNLTDVLYNASVYKDDKGNVLGVFAAARDVTLQKQIKDELLKTQERLNAGLKIANIALSEISYITNTVQLSPESAAMYGFPKNQSEATRQQLHDTFHPAIKAELEAQIIIAMNPDSGGHMALEHSIVLPSGEVRWLKVNKQFFYDHSTQPAKPVYSILVSQDITELKKSSQYARSLIEASLDPLVTISATGKILDVNEASVKVTGVPREKLIDTDFSNYFTEPIKAQEGYSQVFEKGFVADYPLTIKHKNGTLTDVLYNASVYKDDKGNVLGVFAAARDITELKKSSQYARSLIEASLDPLATISASGKILDVNEASVKVTGVAREKLIDTDFSNYFTEPIKAQEGYLQVFDKGFVEDYPLTIKHTNGHLTDVLYNASVYKDDKGNVLGVFAAARDVTEQKRIKEELIEAKIFAEEAQEKSAIATEIAEDAVKAKQQFLSNMSHEIRTPMNAIIGFTKVILKTDLTAKQKEYLSAIKISGDALIVLINDILDLAKVDAGKMHFESTPFKLRASITAMLQIFETKIQEKNLSLIFEYDEKIPEVLAGDPVRLHQIIINLMSNAVKFTSEGNIKVKVVLLKDTDEKVTVEFAIMDTGIGITTDKIDRIFENFQQASSGTSRLYGGTGLGLAIVKQLIERQEGHIKVESVLGQGSTFSFVLDFKKTKANADEVIEIMKLEKEIKNIRVLVVEDMPLNQLLMKTLLDDFGFERDIAANGSLAIERMKTNQYDIVLMDLQMPVMNGFEATKYIRDILKSDIPIIALTADVTTVDLAKCKEVGMNDYVAKPVDERVLYSKILGLIKKSDPQKIIKSEKIKYTDLSYLIQRTKSDPDLMMEMIMLYLEQTPPLILMMKQSLRDKDWAMLGNSIHKMIPSFSIVGFNPNFEKIAKQIQEYAVSQQLADDIDGWVSQIETACGQACEELTVELEKIKTLKITNN
jgi:PAS domain S-box-containing protein